MISPTYSAFRVVRPLMVHWSFGLSLFRPYPHNIMNNPFIRPFPKSKKIVAPGVLRTCFAVGTEFLPAITVSLRNNKRPVFGGLPQYFFAYSTVHSTIPLWDLALSSSAVFLSNARHIIQRNRVLAAGGAVLSTSLSGSLSPHPARGSFFIAGCTCSAAADHELEGAAMHP